MEIEGKKGVYTYILGTYTSCDPDLQLYILRKKDGTESDGSTAVGSIAAYRPVLSSRLMR